MSQLQSILEELQNKQKIEQGRLPKIFCDMDQVLVNFMLGAQEVLGVAFNEYPGEKEEKWQKLKQVNGFWANLPIMPDGMLLWKYIRDFEPASLSTPSRRMPTCKVEKILWLRTHLRFVGETHIVRRQDKKKYAVADDGYPNLLIDDYKKNILEWETAGGIGILHKDTLSTIRKLKNLGYTK